MAECGEWEKVEGGQVNGCGSSRTFSPGQAQSRIDIKMPRGPWSLGGEMVGDLNRNTLGMFSFTLLLKTGTPDGTAIP